MEYRFDGDEMLATAKVVLFINPSARECFETPEDLVEQMKADVRINLKSPGYLSIYGYVLTTYWYSILPVHPTNPGTLGVKASLDTGLVAKFWNVSGAR